MAVDGPIDCHIRYMPSVFGDRLRQILAGDKVMRSVVASRPAWRDLSVHSKGGLVIALHVVDTEAFTFGHVEYPIVDLQTGKGIPSNSYKFTKFTEG